MMLYLLRDVSDVPVANRLVCLRMAIALLPDAHLNALRQLLQLLRSVSILSSFNQVDFIIILITILILGNLLFQSD